MSNTESPTSYDGSEFVAYFAPLFAYILLASVQESFPELGIGGFAARIAVALALFLFFWQRGAYPELKGWRPGVVGIVLDVVVGLAVCALWMAPYILIPSLQPDPAEAFNPGSFGAGNEQTALALRFIGFALLIPFIEELPVRSFLIRYADVFDSEKSFRGIPIGTFTMRSFLVTVAWFTFTHAQWEWPVAAATGIIYNVWLYKRKHIGDLILTHGVTNCALFLWVVTHDGLMYFL